MKVKQVLPLILLLSAFGSIAFAQDVSVYANGLEGPRGLKFGPDGALYVAEAGHGGPELACVNVPIVGPYHGGPTARISKITGPHERSTVVDGLPSALSSLPSGDTQGVAAVAFLGDNLFAVLAGGGCSHGNASAPNGVIRVDRKNGTWKYIDNLSAFFLANQVVPPPADLEPEGTPFAMLTHKGHFYAVESNQGQVIRVNPGGQTERLVQISATEGHVVPTAIAFHNGNFYVGTLSTFPIQPGTARVYQVSEKGKILGFQTGFTTVTGIEFDAKGRMYVLELSAAPGFPSPGAGKIVRVNESGQIEDFVTGLVVPTGITLGPDGALYVSDFGAAPPGLGQILRITIPD
jgi:hypothetical protein